MRPSLELLASSQLAKPRFAFWLPKGPHWLRQCPLRCWQLRWV